MFSYQQYADKRQEILGKPIWDAVNKVFTLTGTVIYSIKKDALLQANTDAQTNITAIDNYDPIAAKADFQGAIQDISTALTTAI